MLRKLRLLIIFLVASAASYAQADSSSHLRISLVTCGPGDEEIWEVFGHTAVRVIDSTKHTDIVFNYGTFEFGPNFEVQFMRGKLLYCLSAYPFNDFMQEYVQAKRSVQEQELLLNTSQKDHVYSFLKWNLHPENKYYKYDFFFDNCATRIRDIFPGPDVFGKDFVFGQTIPADSKMSFRNIIDRYFYRDHWTRFGINILLGSKIDKIMSNTDIMFLPDYLRDGITGATVKGKRISTEPKLILPGAPQSTGDINQAAIVMWIVALLTIVGLCVPSLYRLGNVMSALLLVVTGLLGVLIFVMWFATDHQGCTNNYNILWALPTNIAAAFMSSKRRSRYALIGIVLILVSLILHVLRVQELPIVELSPLLLALLFVYGTIYKRSKVKTA